MKLDFSRLDSRGQAAVVWTTISTIIALVIGIIVIHQFFVSGAGPTNNENDSNYDKDALDSYNRVKTLAWVAIGILSLVILALAAVTIMSVFRGGMGGGQV